jgi:hypothetical protein
MIAPLAKLIDWSALQVVYAIALRSAKVLRTDSPFDRHFARAGASAPESKWKLAEALEFLNGPDFIPAASCPAQLELDGPGHFKFPTPRPCEDEENNIAYGRLYRCAQRWQERPVIVLLDGTPAVGYHTAFPWLARRFNRAEFNVAALVAAYHLQRRPRRPMEWNCLELAQAIAQNVAEIRALTGWLLDAGCPSVGLLGFSFGGWMAGLTACSDARIASAVLTVPAVRLTRFSHPIFWRRVFRALRPAHEAMDTTRLNLILSHPVIPKENILLIEGIYDLFAEAQPIEELWQKWGQPEIWRLPHGHISGLFVPSLSGRVLRWLAPRLEAGRKNNV